MNEVLPVIIVSATAYAVACGVLGVQPGAPIWLRWPLPIWNWIAHGGHRPPPVPRRPDYGRIAHLERELGMSVEQPMRPHSCVCLTKDCGGDAQEIRTWSGQLVRRVHHCEDRH